jgi:hypothetical protein
MSRSTQDVALKNNQIKAHLVISFPMMYILLWSCEQQKWSGWMSYLREHALKKSVHDFFWRLKSCLHTTSFFGTRICSEDMTMACYMMQTMFSLFAEILKLLGTQLFRNMLILIFSWTCILKFYVYNIVHFNKIYMPTSMHFWVCLIYKLKHLSKSSIWSIFVIIGFFHL